MDVGRKLNMIRWALPSLHSPFTTNSSPLWCSPSIRGKELDFGSAKLSLMAFSFDENEMLHRDSLRPHACLSSSPQTLESDYSNMEMLIGKRSHKGLHNMISDAQPSEKDISIFIHSLQVCSGSHFHLLMENVKVLENRIADSDSIRKDVLLQLGRLGELELFHACLSRNLEDPTISTGPNSLATFTKDCQVKERMSDDSAQNMVCSKKKHERKARNERRLQMAGKKLACDSESSIERFSQLLASAAANKKATDKRVMLAKNEAAMSRGIRVVAKLERVKARLEKEIGKAVSLSSWAEAAGIDQKVLQHYLHFGWYCRDELLKSGRSLVFYLARNYRGRGVAREDLVQAGNIGILQGAEKFDHTMGYKFSTYVQYWIRQAMYRVVSRHNGRGIKIPLTLSTAINHVQRARKALKTALGKHPDDVELAKFTGLSLDKIKSTETCLRVVGSIEQKVGCYNGVKFLECTPDTSMEMPEKIILREHMRNDLNKLLKDLNPKQRRVLVLRYGFEGPCMSLQEVGKILDVTKEWIRQIEMKALTRLKVEENLKNLRHYLEP